MNAIIALCHFCENHGPSVLFCTQTFQSDLRGESSLPVTFFGPDKKLQEYLDETTQNPTCISCEACQPVSRYISNDYTNKFSYLSCERPIDDNVSKLVKQAAVRSLSCEIVPGKQGEMYFGDDVRGHVISQTFFLEDSQARGFHRWYSVIVFMRDKHFLQNSWMFIEKHVSQLIKELQKKAAEVYAREQQECPQRALRFAEGDQRSGGNRSARRITELTAESNLFAQIHLWFSWILSTGAKRLEAQMPTTSINNMHQRTENGFIIVEQFNADTVRLLRQLCTAVGIDKFRSLLYAVCIGRQLVVRGPKTLVQIVINNLRLVLPSSKCGDAVFAETYIDSIHSFTNVIGLSLTAAVPIASAKVERLDIVPLSTEGNAARSEFFDLSLDDHQFMAKSGSQLPAKLPSFVSSLHSHLIDLELSDQLAYLLITALIEKWSSRASVLQKCRSLGRDASKFLQAEGVLESDLPLLDFWSS